MSAPRGRFGKVYDTLWTGSLRARPVPQLVFVYLLAHCDAEGVVDVTAQTIADATGHAVPDVRTALGELEAPDPDSRSRDEDGRRLVRLDPDRDWGWRIVNLAKYRGHGTASRSRAYRERNREEIRARDRARKQMQRLGRDPRRGVA